MGVSGELGGAGHFDLIVVDEAHRSIYKTFELENGVPTDAYP